MDFNTDDTCSGSLIKEVDHNPRPAIFEYRNIGPMMEHNYLCAVCRNKAAVINTNTGILNPCWDCQKKYKVIKITWLDRLLGR